MLFKPHADRRTHRGERAFFSVDLRPCSAHHTRERRGVNALDNWCATPERAEACNTARRSRSCHAVTVVDKGLQTGFTE